MQRYELEAWLGDDHGLTNEQVTDLLREADRIAQQWPDSDDQEERTAALATAYQLIRDEDGDGGSLIIDALARELFDARIAEARALAGIRQAAHMLVTPGGDRTVRGVRSVAGFAGRAGVDRHAVLGWLGRR